MTAVPRRSARSNDETPAQMRQSTGVIRRRATHATTQGSAHKKLSHSPRDDETPPIANRDRSGYLPELTSRGGEDRVPVPDSWQGRTRRSGCIRADLPDDVAPPRGRKNCRRAVWAAAHRVLQVLGGVAEPDGRTARTRSVNDETAPMSSDAEQNNATRKAPNNARVRARTLAVP